jgi:hypothetical protein
MVKYIYLDIKIKSLCALVQKLLFEGVHDLLHILEPVVTLHFGVRFLKMVPSVSPWPDAYTQMQKSRFYMLYNKIYILYNSENRSFLRDIGKKSLHFERLVHTYQVVVVIQN